MNLGLFYAILSWSVSGGGGAGGFQWDSVHSNGTWVFSNGFLTATGASVNTTAYVVNSQSGSRSYTELTINTVGAGGRPIIGLDGTNTHPGDFIGDNVPSNRVSFGQWSNNTSSLGGSTSVTNPRAVGVSWATGDVVQIAFDYTNGKIWFGKNGTWSGSYNPAGGSSPNFTWPATTPAWIGISDGGSPYPVVTLPANTGAMTYNPPVGFLGWDGTQYNGSNTVYWDTLNCTGSYAGTAYYNLTNNQRTCLYDNTVNTSPYLASYLNSAITTGKRYVEFVVGPHTLTAGYSATIGFTATRGFAYNATSGSTSYGVGFDNTLGDTVGLLLNGGVNMVSVHTSGTFTSHVASAAGITPASGSVIMLAVDMSTGDIWWGFNGTWLTQTQNGSAAGNPGAGTGPSESATWLPGTTQYIGFSVNTNGDSTPIGLTVNGSSSQWTYTRPTGFLGLDGS